MLFSGKEGKTVKQSALIGTSQTVAFKLTSSGGEFVIGGIGRVLIAIVLVLMLSGAFLLTK
jgi:hypothetical protein